MEPIFVRKSANCSKLRTYEYCTYWQYVQYYASNDVKNTRKGSKRMLCIVALFSTVGSPLLHALPSTMGLSWPQNIPPLLLLSAPNRIMPISARLSMHNKEWRGGPKGGSRGKVGREEAFLFKIEALSYAVQGTPQYLSATVCSH